MGLLAKPGRAEVLSALPWADRTRPVTRHLRFCNVMMIAIIAGLLFAGCNQQSTSLPPLLQNATAGSGWASACPHEMIPNGK